MGSDLGVLDIVAGLSVLGGCLSKLPRVMVVLLSVSCLCVLGEESLLRWVDLRRDLDLLDDLFSRVKLKEIFDCSIQVDQVEVVELVGPNLEE